MREGKGRGGGGMFLTGVCALVLGSARYWRMGRIGF